MCDACHKKSSCRSDLLISAAVIASPPSTIVINELIFWRSRMKKKAAHFVMGATKDAECIFLHLKNMAVKTAEKNSFLSL